MYSCGYWTIAIYYNIWLLWYWWCDSKCIRFINYVCNIANIIYKQIFKKHSPFRKNKIDYKDLIKKIIIILIPIICIIGVVFISENKYIDKNSQTFTHLKIIDKTKEENITCNTALEQFYEDKEYIYYFPCEKSKYVIVIYSNGYQETVKSSLEYGDITIEDLEKNNIEFIKQKKDMSNWQITISWVDN